MITYLTFGIGVINDLQEMTGDHSRNDEDVRKLEREFKEVADEEHIIEKKVADMNSKMDKFFDEMRASVRLQSGAENAQRASLTPVSGAQILRRVDKDFEKVQGEVAAMAKEEHMLSEQMATMQSQLDSFFHDIRAGVGDRQSSMRSQQSFFQQQSSARSQQPGATPMHNLPSHRSMHSNGVKQEEFRTQDSRGNQEPGYFTNAMSDGDATRLHRHSGRIATSSFRVLHDSEGRSPRWITVVRR